MPTLEEGLRAGRLAEGMPVEIRSNLSNVLLSPAETGAERHQKVKFKELNFILVKGEDRELYALGCQNTNSWWFGGRTGYLGSLKTMDRVCASLYGNNALALTESQYRYWIERWWIYLSTKRPFWLSTIYPTRMQDERLIYSLKYVQDGRVSYDDFYSSYVNDAGKEEYTDFCFFTCCVRPVIKLDPNTLYLRNKQGKLIVNY